MTCPASDANTTYNLVPAGFYLEKAVHNEDAQQWLTGKCTLEFIRKNVYRQQLRKGKISDEQ